tara:strand:- start:93439 stop:93846 length:408 start_codon:yes stop_codon:yes gene_type:complete
VKREQIILVYDEECPACHAYCQVVNIRRSVGDLILVNAREESDIMEEITAKGLDVDQGMVLKIGEQLYFGADAIHALALIGSRYGILNRINYWLFKSKTVSGVLYPVLRCFRNLLLKILGKKKVNNLRLSGNDKF